uniref:Glycoprotein gp65 n=2 Tax=Human betaherpesvirus 7 TaxID=10372 RepID=Q9QCU9_9BETA|nr:glycoprotein gp65 [Human betaherpesvirus 7]
MVQLHYIIFASLIKICTNTVPLEKARTAITLEDIIENLINENMHNASSTRYIGLSSEERQSLLEYTRCTSFSCECEWPDEAQVILLETTLCIPLKENSLGVRGLREKIMSKGLSEVLSVTTGLHYSLLNGGFGSKQNSLLYVKRMNTANILTSLVLFPARHRWERREQYTQSSAQCELQIRADFKKMRSYSGIAFRTQISLAIVRKDNKGYEWETCMQFSQWKEEDFNIPKVNMTSEKPLYDACCPDKNKSRENTTYAWRWSEHPWTETTIEPWRDIDIIRQIPTDERCLTNTTVFQSTYGQIWCSPKNDTTARNYVTTVILFPIALLEIERLFDTIGQKTVQDMFPHPHRQSFSNREFDPAIVSAMWQDFPSKISTTDLQYDVLLTPSKDFGPCSIKIKTDSAKTEFDNGRLLTIDTLLLTFLKKDDRTTKKLISNKSLNAQLCNSGNITQAFNNTVSEKLQNVMGG